VDLGTFLTSLKILNEFFKKIHVHLVKCRNKNSILKRLKVLQ